MTAFRHVALIPARAGSQGIPHKNRLLFDMTVSFIQDLGFFDEIVVSTNDDEIVAEAQRRGLRVRRRPDELAGPAMPIKPAFEDLVAALDLPADAYLWLFYIPFVFRDAADFHAARALVERDRPISVSTFVPAETHPYRCWGQDPATGKMFKFIDSPAVSRQDFPPAWSNHHYIYTILCSALDKVNGNLLGPDTTPIYFDAAQAARLIELDEMEDLVAWSRRYPEDYARWWNGLDPAVRIGPAPVATP